MNADRWRVVNSLFHAALELDSEKREAFLRQRAAADPDLVREVQSRLACHQPGTDFLEAPAWTVAASLMMDGEPSLVGRQVGSYRILEEIGRGGMGVVYAARDERLGRTVTLKALPPEYTRDQRHRERLAREARAAAAFTHESIATVGSFYKVYSTKSAHFTVRLLFLQCYLMCDTLLFRQRPSHPNPEADA